MRWFVLGCGLTTWLAACAVSTESHPLADGGAGEVADAAASDTPSADAGTTTASPEAAGAGGSDVGEGQGQGHAMSDDTERPSPLPDAGAANDAQARDEDEAPSQDAGEPTVDAMDGGPQASSDAAVLDAGSSDAAPADAGSPDADSPDADSPDAGASDAAAGEPDAGAQALPLCDGPPGMFADTRCQVLSLGIEPYRPQYPLWSDGAKKDRYIYLPPGTRIDTSNPDRWSFPVGTRFYKTFAAGDTLVETRVLEKMSAATGFTSWTALSYAWGGTADHLSVSPAPSEGVSNARGTTLDIPSQAQCRSCHNMTGADAAIGFNALQLNHADGGLGLPQLLERGLLVTGSGSAPLNISVENSQIPGDALAKAALGYLHGNCGHCHGGPSPRAGQRLWSVVGMTQLGEAPIFESAVCECIAGWTGRRNTDGEPFVLRVAPSHAAVSGIVGRMGSRTSREQMPPIGTEVVDSAGLATVKAWIDSLDGTSCDAAPPVCGG